MKSRENDNAMTETSQILSQLAAPVIAPEAEIVRKITTANPALSAQAIKRILRDVQYELTSAWKFFMGLGKDKQVLVLVDGFTTLPLSLARNCAYAIVYGLLPDEITLFRELAILKGISNYSCIADLTTLATTFDLIVSAVTRPENSILSIKKDEVGRLLHDGSEFWIITTNRLSLGYLKETLRSLWSKPRHRKATQENGITSTIRVQFGCSRSILTRQAKAYLEEINCKPYQTIGLAPTIFNARTAEPWGPGTVADGKARTPSHWQRLLSEDLVIGAALRQPGKSFIDRFLSSVPETTLRNGQLEKYFISAGGKVLVFARFTEAEEPFRVLIKLPLNHQTEQKLSINHRFLEYFASSYDIGDNRRLFFPYPVAAANFENQPFFAERWLPGQSWDVMPMSKLQRVRLTYEVFSFWLGVQNTYARPYFFDHSTYEKLIEQPLQHVFNYFEMGGFNVSRYERITAYLRERLFQKEFTLSLVHGDFSEKNIILEGQTLTLRGIIDWDMARQDAFPVLDAFHFFVRRFRSSQSKCTVKILYDLLHGKIGQPHFAKIVKFYRESFHFDESALQPLLIVYWLYRMFGHLSTLKYMDANFVRRNFNEPLELFDQMLDGKK